MNRQLMRKIMDNYYSENYNQMKKLINKYSPNLFFNDVIVHIKNEYCYIDNENNGHLSTNWARKEGLKELLRLYNDICIKYHENI